MEANGYRYEFDWDVAMQLGEKLLVIAVILVVTWALAKAAKWAIEKLANAIPLLQRSDGTGKSIGTSLGIIAAAVVWLIGLVVLLQRLGFDEALLPVQSLLTEVGTAIPNIVLAGVIFFIGVVLARIARQIIETALTAVNLDQWAAKGGVENVVATNRISSIIATVVYAIIIILFGIVALDTLNIEAISGPATDMLRLVFDSIPRVIGALILLGLGYMIARWVSGLLSGLLQDLGFDRAIHGMEIMPATSSPAKIVGNIVMIAILITFGIAATRMLGFPELTNILNEVLAMGGNIVFGIAVIAVGFLLANLLASIVASMTDSSELAVNLARWVTIALFIVMGLSQMGIGGQIVEYAFLAIAVGVALAIAIAFGWGGREEAARVLSEARSKAKASANTPPKKASAAKSRATKPAAVERRVPPRGTKADRKTP